MSSNKSEKTEIVPSEFIIIIDGVISKEKIFFKTISLNHGKTKSIIYIFEDTAYMSDCNDFSIL